MATPLKLMFDSVFLDQVAQALDTIHPGQGIGQRFVSQVLAPHWESLDLNERVYHLADVLAELWGTDFTTTHRHVLALTDHLLAEGKYVQGYAYMFLPAYVQRYGLDDPRQALHVMERLTQLVSCEFAIRPLLVSHEPLVMLTLHQWAAHPNHHVRRLASEGCRPRLPWGLGLRQFVANPSPLLPLLEKLLGDPSLYVRKSVANNLNDISKTHPDLVLALAERHIGQRAETDWILNHALRTLLKAGNRRALSLFGWGEVGAQAQLALAEPVGLGETATFQVALTLAENQPDLRLEYAIGFHRASGKASRKVFQYRKGAFAAGVHTFTIRHSFADLSTRKHYAGPHTIELLVNGTPVATLAFALEGELVE